jgi:hypothetical protein
MTRLCTSIFTGVMLCGVTFAQQTSAGSASGMQPPQSPAQSQPTSSSMPSNQTPRIAPGSVIPVQLTKGIDAKKVKTGDAVEAKVTQDLKSTNGEILLPKNTKVMGRVTEAQERNKQQKESEVGIAFDHTVMKNGDETKLPMSIQAIIAPAYLSPSPTASSQEAAQQPSAPAGGMSPNMGSGHPSATGAPAQPTGAAPVGADTGNTQANAHPPVTENTKGVLGMQNVNLSTATSAAQGSVISSDKNNVKLEGGTLILLRVNQ